MTLMADWQWGWLCILQLSHTVFSITLTYCFTLALHTYYAASARAGLCLRITHSTPSVFLVRASGSKKNARQQVQQERRSASCWRCLSVAASILDYRILAWYLSIPVKTQNQWNLLLWRAFVTTVAFAVRSLASSSFSKKGPKCTQTR